MGGGGGGGRYAKSFSCLTQLKVMLGCVELWLSWGFDNIDFINILLVTLIVILVVVEKGSFSSLYI